MAALGFPDGKLLLVATLELLSAALFLYPRTRSMGLLVLSSFLGGAICTQVQLGEYAKVGGPSILLSLAWLGTWLRHPQVLWSLNPRRADTNQLVENRGEGWASRDA
jgi:DoxX-like family